MYYFYTSQGITLLFLTDFLIFLLLLLIFR